MFFEKMKSKDRVEANRLAYIAGEEKKISLSIDFIIKEMLDRASERSKRSKHWWYEITLDEPIAFGTHKGKVLSDMLSEFDSERFKVLFDYISWVIVNTGYAIASDAIQALDDRRLEYNDGKSHYGHQLAWVHKPEWLDAKPPELPEEEDCEESGDYYDPADDYRDYMRLYNDDLDADQQSPDFWNQF